MARSRGRHGTKHDSLSSYLYYSWFGTVSLRYIHQFQHNPLHCCSASTRGMMSTSTREPLYAIHCCANKSAVGAPVRDSAGARVCEVPTVAGGGVAGAGQGDPGVQRGVGGGGKGERRGVCGPVVYRSAGRKVRLVSHPSVLYPHECGSTDVDCQPVLRGVYGWLLRVFESCWQSRRVRPPTA